MNDRQLREVLVELDPARGISVPAGSSRDKLLHEIKTAPVIRAPSTVDDTAHRLRMRAPRLALAGLAAVVTITVGIAIGWARTGEVAEPLAARAYAAAAPPRDVLHARIRSTTMGANGGVQSERTDEWWIRPDGAGYVSVAQLQTPGPEKRIVTSTDRSSRTTWVDGTISEQVAGSASPARAGVFNPSAEFRRFYDQGQMREAGFATLGAEPVRRFLTRDGDSFITYDVDAHTLKARRWTIELRAPDGRVKTTTTYAVDQLDETNVVPDPQALLTP